MARQSQEGDKCGGQHRRILVRQATMSLNDKMTYFRDRADESHDLRVAALRNRTRSVTSRRPEVEAINVDKLAGVTGGGMDKGTGMAKGFSRTASGLSLAVCVSVTDSTHELMEAAEKGDAGTVRNVLKKTSADLNFGHEGDYRTALLRACQYGQIDVVTELLQAGADTGIRTIKNRTLLHEACVGGHVGVLTLLLDLSDLDAADVEGQSACHVAAFQGELECLRLLSEKGANASLEDKTGKSPAHLAAQRNHPRILSYLLNEGVDIEATDKNGRRPVHIAALHGGLESLVLFAQADCDIIATDKSGCLPAHYAAKTDQLDCLRFLVKHGTDVEVKDGSGRTLAHMAALFGAMTCLHWLLEKHANPMATDHEGNTPAHLAATGGHGKCFNCCLQHDGRLEALNAKGHTPMDCAKKSGHPQLMGKAGNDEIRCIHCADNYQMVEWERTHQPSNVHKAMSSKKGAMFTSPLPRKPQAQDVQRQRVTRPETTPVKPTLPKRDLAARYFGYDDDG